VWLALLEKGVQFDEVLIELQGRKPGWYYEITNGSTPAVRWADGTYQVRCRLMRIALMTKPCCIPLAPV
jgi:glutathione S-transferase